jgi:hypothetical protein
MHPLFVLFCFVFMYVRVRRRADVCTCTILTQEICILDALSVNSTCQTRLVSQMMRGHGRRTCLQTTFVYVHELLTMLLLRCVSLVRVRPPHLQRESREILYTRGAVLALCSLLHDDIDAWA